MQLQHQYSQEDTILKAQLDTGKDADAAAIEAQREGMRLEADATRLAMQVDGERQKLNLQEAKNRMELGKKAALDKIAIENAKLKASQKAKPEDKPEAKGDEE